MLFHKGFSLAMVKRFLLILTLIFFITPRSVYAKPSLAVPVKFEIASVKADESVTIRTVDFPVRTNFTAIMGKATNKAVNGVVSTEFNSGDGGEFEIVLPIPDEVKGVRIIGIRIESKDGYQGYNWFFNRTQTSMIPDPNLKPDITFSNVKKNTSVDVKAINLPPLTMFRVRVGPYDTFYSNYTSVDMVTTDGNGSASYTISLGANVKDEEFISVRMDGGGTYLFGTFQNIDGGKEATTSDLVKVVPCTIISINPIPPLPPRDDFDVIWTIQNTGLEDWNVKHYLFKYREGDEMHKYEGKVFLPYTIERGWTHEVVVDMRAPETPGWHSTTWALVDRFDVTICTFKVSVFVKE
jgi:hypothetical protein